MVLTASTCRQFHLIDAEGNGGRRSILRVPDGMSRLITGRDGTAPRLLPEGAAGAAGGVLLEPVAWQRDLLLLIVSPPDRPLLVNGASAGRLSRPRLSSSTSRSAADGNWPADIRYNAALAASQSGCESRKERRC